MKGWQRTGENEYSRPYDALEKFCYTFFEEAAPEGFREFDLIVSLKLDFAQDPESLVPIVKEAWKNLRYKHPTIAAQSDKEKFIYRSPTSGEELQKWADETFMVKGVQPIQDDNIENVAVLERTDWPVLAYIPSEKQLVIRMPHMYTDGLGAVILSDDLLTELGRLDSIATSQGSSLSGTSAREFGSDVENLPGGGLAAVNVPAPSAEELENLQASWSEIRTDEAVRLPAKSQTATVVPGQGRIQRLQFSAEETARIVSYASDSGLRVTPLVHAAMLHAARSQRLRLDHNNDKDRDSTTHSDFLVFNFRDLCQDALGNPDQRGLPQHITAWVSQFQVSDRSHDTALTMRNEYNRIRGANRRNILSTTLLRCAKTLPLLAENIQSSVIMSSLGNLDPMFQEGKMYGSIKLQQFFGLGLPCSRLVAIGLQTFADHLEMSAVYNEAYHDDEQIRDLLQLIKQEIETMVPWES
ncbi:hypothetical protein ASPWEDRAFT_28500 [Aspergillus wentii DTO 134E9]|uniref:Condensation domain-containing protein n=1 Tax=Aspergillus wentii DTO 134E9 TaxID=1073089 RepID=A0A1L9RLY7_ASPWE|nr:uncharacterized protein ASPWEDRAFT_28500 [Aspergillus wentii DTO 134E9]OJJ35903.1 hypothetical protein ASPWEDRAFT_28500 [Aspergillus wentii DTO 134E9]